MNKLKDKLYYLMIGAMIIYILVIVISVIKREIIVRTCNNAPITTALKDKECRKIILE